MQEYVPSYLKTDWSFKQTLIQRERHLDFQDLENMQNTCWTHTIPCLRPVFFQMMTEMVVFHPALYSWTLVSGLAFCSNYVCTCDKIWFSRVWVIYRLQTVRFFPVWVSVRVLGMKWRVHCIGIPKITFFNIRILWFLYFIFLQPNNCLSLCEGPEN